MFSATSGQLADKYPKEVLIRLVKNLEIVIMALAGWGFLQQNVAVLLTCVFLMGLHSTLFGPVKFAYLPQHLSERELTGGNGMVEMGTFVAILLGNVAGGLLIAMPLVGPAAVAAACLTLALLGRVLAQAVPASPPTDAALVINWNPFTETWRNLRLAHGNIVVFRSLLGISWMWFFGAVFLSNFLPLRTTCCAATSGWPRCCWWCSRWASARARCCAGAQPPACGGSAWCRWAPLA